MNAIIQVSKDELENLFKETIEGSITKALSEFTDKMVEPKSYFRNQVAKKFKMGNSTVQKLIDDGVFKTTDDGKRVTRDSVEAYFKLNVMRRKPRNSSNKEA